MGIYWDSTPLFVNQRQVRSDAQQLWIAIRTVCKNCRSLRAHATSCDLFPCSFYGILRASASIGFFHSSTQVLIEGSKTNNFLTEIKNKKRHYFEVREKKDSKWDPIWVCTTYHILEVDSSRLGSRLSSSSTYARSYKDYIGSILELDQDRVHS